MTNEAADRLREHLSNLTTERVYDVAWLDALDEALTAERRATVERIRLEVRLSAFAANKQPLAELYRILDDEAE